MNINVIGVPVDLGADRRGVDMGPSAIRYAGLKSAVEKMKIGYRDAGNIDVPIPENLSTDRYFKYIDEIRAVNQKLFGKVRESFEAGCMPVVLGGDHSIGTGTVLGTQSVLKKIGVLWIDAHGDFNTRETTRSGNLHGMSLAAATGAGALEMADFKPHDVEYVNPHNVVLIGARSIDNEEAVLLKKSGVTVFTMTDIDMMSMREVMNRALEIALSGTEGFHLSFDMDVISPNEAPGVGTPVNGGLTFREAHLAVEMVADSNKMRSMEVVEVNPILDRMNQTGKLAVSLICSAIGQKIM
jgi:arginase